MNQPIIMITVILSILFLFFLFNYSDNYERECKKHDGHVLNEKCYDKDKNPIRVNILSDLKETDSESEVKENE